MINEEFVHLQSTLTLIMICLNQAFLPFLESESVSHSVMPDSLWPYGLYSPPDSSVHSIAHSPPDSSVHSISQARILEWVAILFSRGSSPPRDQTWVSCIAGRFFAIWATREAPGYSVKVKVSVTQPRPALCDPMDCSPPGSSVHGILQARILEWVAISLSRGSSRLRDWTWVSHIADRLFTNWVTREDLGYSV